MRTQNGRDRKKAFKIARAALVFRGLRVVLSPTVKSSVALLPVYDAINVVARRG